MVAPASIVCHKPASVGCTHADRDTVLSLSDLVVVVGARATT
jgi:hypothetical protein